MYPTDEALAALHAEAERNPTGALQTARSLWHWQEGVTDQLSAHEGYVVRAERADRFMRFATGGWSGNEDVLAALRGTMTWGLCWCLSARGGLHIFRLPAQAASGSTNGG